MQSQSLNLAKKRASFISNLLGKAILSVFDMQPLNPPKLLSFLYLLHDIIINAAKSTLPLLHLLLAASDKTSKPEGEEDCHFLPWFLPQIFSNLSSTLQSQSAESLGRITHLKLTETAERMLEKWAEEQVLPEMLLHGLRFIFASNILQNLK